MSNKITRCGIYSISTPNGSVYVGGSNKIERRWHEHRSNLRNGKHHSSRLQAAWNKHGAGLRFEVLQECPVHDLNRLEQEWIDRLGADLNTSMFVENVWLNPETKAKLNAIHTSPEWRQERARIAASSSSRWVAVDCEDGRSFKNMADAARAFNVGIPAIRYVSRTQRAGKIGVRLKLASDEWRDVVSAEKQRHLTMIERGTNKRTEESKQRMSAAAKSRKSA